MPPLVQTICKVLERIAPLKLAAKWDNVGLLLESPVQRTQGPQRVLLTIDLTSAVLADALKTHASVIVAYHPAIFRGLKSLTLSGGPTSLPSSLLQCVASGISVYSPHTALDSVWGGVNDWLADGVLNGDAGAGKTSGLLQEKLGPAGETEGAVGRLVTLNEPLEISQLHQRIKKHLGVKYLQVGNAEGLPASIKTVAICAGSGGDMLLGTPADLYLTGEMSHHEVLAASAAGKHVVLAGHTNTERGYLPILAERIREELAKEGQANVEVIVSGADKHPLDII